MDHPRQEPPYSITEVFKPDDAWIVRTKHVRNPDDPRGTKAELTLQIPISALMFDQTRGVWTIEFNGEQVTKIVRYLRPGAETRKNPDHVHEKAEERIQT